jgi:hypothetical protein
MTSNSPPRFTAAVNEYCRPVAGIDERLLLGGSLHMHVPWIRAPKPREERRGGLGEAAYLLFA